MGHWGWRPLVMCAFVSVWVVGCNLTLDPPANATVTPSPQITLTVGRIGPPPPAITIATMGDERVDPAMVTAETAITLTFESSSTPVITPTPLIYTVLSGDTLLDIALRYDLPLETLRAANPEAVGLLQVGQNLRIPPTPDATSSDASATPPLMLPEGIAPTALALIVHPPMCYRSRRASGMNPTSTPPPNRPVGVNVMCLGRVENTLDTAAERVSVMIDIDLEGVIGDERAAVEQSRIQPGASAAYHAFFTLPGDTQFEEMFPARATLQTADAASDDSGFIDLEVIDARGEWQGDQFIVTATAAWSVPLENSSEAPAVSIRAFVTLFAPVGEVETVIGYRIAELSETLLPGERADLRIAVIPLIAAPTSDDERAATRYSLVVEARRG